MPLNHCNCPNCQTQDCPAAIENADLSTLVETLRRKLRAYEIETEEPACNWEADDDGNYHTQCSNIFVFIEGTPHGNNFTHCPYCGRKLKLIQHHER